MEGDNRTVPLSQDYLDLFETNYFSLPWEYEADLYGNVRGGAGRRYDVLEHYFAYSYIVYMLT